ncbi:energy coupling factor transporter S component ThiW [Tetragenococcus halophilus]|uniref:energy coupling factor transporter S component ThiW n=1 Tax=Tetragenococcus halophilus TaxID=51669 RepID=UPI0030F11E32
MRHKKTKKTNLLAIMIALDVVLSPILRIEGMAPMSSVINVFAGVLMGPLYATTMAFICGIIRMAFLGIPPLALTGAVFGAFLAAELYRIFRNIYASMAGEIIGTGIIRSLLSYPVMVVFTGASNQFYWFIYTPRFLGAAVLGSIGAWFVWRKVKDLSVVRQMKSLFN